MASNSMRRTPQERIRARQARARIADERREAWEELVKIADHLEQAEAETR